MNEIEFRASQERDATYLLRCSGETIHFQVLDTLPLRCFPEDNMLCANLKHYMLKT